MKKTNASRRRINNWGSVVGKIEKELIIHNQVITNVVYRCAKIVDRIGVDIHLENRGAIRVNKTM